jgi:hypothetical protein
MSHLVADLTKVWDTTTAELRESARSFIKQDEWHALNKTSGMPPDLIGRLALPPPFFLQHDSIISRDGAGIALRCDCQILGD